MYNILGKCIQKEGYEILLLCSKEFNLAPKEVCPLTSAPERLPLSSLNSYLIKVSLFT